MRVPAGRSGKVLIRLARRGERIRNRRHTYTQARTGPVCVYRLYGPGGGLLYVGITNNVNRRLNEHREKKWGDQIYRSTVVRYSNRGAALRAEYVAIRKERPKYNITHNRRIFG